MHPAQIRGRGTDWVPNSARAEWEWSTPQRTSRITAKWRSSSCARRSQEPGPSERFHREADLRGNLKSSPSAPSTTPASMRAPITSSRSFWKGSRCARSWTAGRCRSSACSTSPSRWLTRSPPRTKKGVIHRDIKSSNIIITDTGAQAFLTSTGHPVHAGAAEPSRQRGLVEVVSMPGFTLGTVTHMSPEQVEGKDPTRSDQFSAGIVLMRWRPECRRSAALDFR